MNAPLMSRRRRSTAESDALSAGVERDSNATIHMSCYTITFVDIGRHVEAIVNEPDRWITVMV